PFGNAFLGEPALFFWGEAPFLALFGQTMFAARFYAALCGALTLPLFYLLLRRMFGAAVALLGLGLLAVSAAHLNFSRMAIIVIQNPLLTCLSLIALWEGRQTQRPIWWLLAGAFSGLAVYVAYGGRIVPL